MMSQGTVVSLNKNTLENEEEAEEAETLPGNINKNYIWKKVLFQGERGRFTNLKYVHIRPQGRNVGVKILLIQGESKKGLLTF